MRVETDFTIEASGRHQRPAGSMLQLRSLVKRQPLLQPEAQLALVASTCAYGFETETRAMRSSPGHEVCVTRLQSHREVAAHMTIPAAIILCALLLCLGMFQLLLAAGAPIGRLAWGGEHRVLPARLRLGSIISTALYGMFAVVALDRAGLISMFPTQLAQVGIWVIAALLLLGTVPNLMSRSAPERYVMAPLALLLSGLTVVVALG